MDWPSHDTGCAGGNPAGGQAQHCGERLHGEYALRGVRAALSGRLLPATTRSPRRCFLRSTACRVRVRPSEPEQRRALQEVVVTATRREQTLEAVPYSISVVSADQIAASGATDIESLATQVPGLSMYDYGARFAGASTPIIRGINATVVLPGAFAPSSRTRWAPISAIRRSTAIFSWTT